MLLSVAALDTADTAAVYFRAKHLLLIRNDLVKKKDSLIVVWIFNLKFNQSIYLTWSVPLAKKLV